MATKPTVHIPFEALSEAKLILTDDLIRDALEADKAARAARDKQAKADQRQDKLRFAARAAHAIYGE